MSVLLVFFGLLGASIGSFLNVCIDRLPQGKSLAYPPSHCDACQHALSPGDLVPVFSYLLLRGRCRYCGVSIPGRVLWMELGIGLLFALIFWYYGLSVEFAVKAFYGSLFIVLGVIDLERGLILNRIVYPAAAAALIINGFLPGPGLINTLIGGAAGFALLLVPTVVSRGGMGWGDVKMAGLIGLITGFPMVFVSILLGVVLGGLVAGFLLLARIKKRKETIPFGPFLSLTTIATLFWGSYILNWYTGLF